ncbi:hypothetical protein CVT25_003469 [Psilocybe cyanescens]|uniref:Uncharacterized protein n=1 Tax=Psilocybe cyanescens TaxID=93625 RepID=A0A409WM49_PSICY|nr:hypothetical protein CVT25_003469 [Psilocybe cyanescens]
MAGKVAVLAEKVETEAENTEDWTFFVVEELAVASAVEAEEADNVSVGSADIGCSRSAPDKIVAAGYDDDDVDVDVDVDGPAPSITPSFSFSFSRPPLKL